MRVAYLTAGAGGMYCGSCMRDNTLAAALRRQGRDVVLIPVYSPIRTDEENVSIDRVLFGGINVYLQHKSAVYRRTPRFLNRLLDNPALLRRATENAGAPPNNETAALMISILSGESGAQRNELEKLISALAEFRPNIVHLPNVFFVGFAKAVRTRLGAAVVCSLTGEDVFLEKLPEPYLSQALELIGRHGNDVDAFLSVSNHYTKYAANRLKIENQRIHQVPLGIRIEPLPEIQPEGNVPFGEPVGRPFTIGYLARICHDKGLHLLCQAFAELHCRGYRCRLKTAGHLGAADRDYERKVRADLAARGLSEYVEFLGEVDRKKKLELLRSIDVFSVPTVYEEAKGIYVLEALSQGVPVVQPNHGAFPELIAATGGGLLVKPHDAHALADGIERLMNDPPVRRSLGEAGRRAVCLTFTDDAMAERAWKVFESCALPGGDSIAS